MDVVSIMSRFERDVNLSVNVTARRTLPAREATFSPMPAELFPNLTRALAQRGIHELYSHQRETFDFIQRGKNVVVTTPTASGKSLCYLLPILDRICKTPSSRALLLFPTKALSQDQYTELYSLIQQMGLDIKTHPYDGDTPADARRLIRQRGQIIISNPDMLHQAILPHHTKWSKLLANLDFVVLDELHTYRGVFGSHLANVIRRLKRICEFHRSKPQFICSSATIANAADFAAQMLEAPVELVQRNGAPSGEKHLLFYNPPVVNKALGVRANYLKTTVKIAKEFLFQEIPVIIFASSRLNVEIIVKYLKDAYGKALLNPERIQSYRGGYLPQHRRRIERGLRAGTIHGVVATNALELGIDIGNLGVCIIAGYPGSVASLWQQSGRAGRRDEPSATIFVGRSSPLDQFMMQNPDYFFEQSPEHARIDPDNLLILADHLKCAAFELPFDTDDCFGEIPSADLNTVLSHLTKHRVLHNSGSRYHWMQESYPANQVKIRSIPGENFVVIDVADHTIIAEVDYSSAQTTIHPHAIYQVAGIQYQVVRLDWENHKAYVEKVVPDYFTDAMSYTKVDILAIEDSRRNQQLTIEVGDVSVTEKVVGFKKIRFYTSENVGFGEINLPELTMHTTAYWFTVPRSLLIQLGFPQSDALDGLMGLSHALHSVASITLMCDPRDLGRCVGDRDSRWFSQINTRDRGTFPSHPDGDEFDPTVFIYERYPGGVGFSRTLLTEHDRLLIATTRLLRNCPCEIGCPSCVGATMVDAEISTKQVALQILDTIGGSQLRSSLRALLAQRNADNVAHL